MAEYGLELRDEHDLVRIARLLRGALGIGAHESAWREAVELVGSIRAATMLCYVLQLHSDDVASGENRIRNPGDYFRAMIRKMAERGFDMEAELLRLRRRHMT